MTAPRPGASPFPAASPGGGVTHDLRHGLAALQALVTAAQTDGPAAAELPALLATASCEIRYALQLVDALPASGALHRRQAAPAAPEPGCDLTDVLTEAARAAGPRSGSVLVEAAPSLPVAVPRTTATRIVRNVLQNALTATAPAGGVLLRGVRDGASVRLEVHDDGPGPGPGGFSRDGGVGLSVVRSLVLAAGGWLVLGRSAMGGARVAVTLPTAQGEGPG